MSEEVTSREEVKHNHNNESDMDISDSEDKEERCASSSQISIEILLTTMQNTIMKLLNNSVYVNIKQFKGY